MLEEAKGRRGWDSWVTSMSPSVPPTDNDVDIFALKIVGAAAITAMSLIFLLDIILRVI